MFRVYVTESMKYFISVFSFYKIVALPYDGRNYRPKPVVVNVTN